MIEQKYKDNLYKLFTGHENCNLLMYSLDDGNLVIVRGVLEDEIERITTSLIRTLDEYSIDEHNSKVERIRALRVYDTVITDMIKDEYKEKVSVE